MGKNHPSYHCLRYSGIHMLLFIDSAEKAVLGPQRGVQSRYSSLQDSTSELWIYQGGILKHKQIPNEVYVDSEIHSPPIGRPKRRKQPRGSYSEGEK